MASLILITSHPFNENTLRSFLTVLGDDTHGAHVVAWDAPHRQAAYLSTHGQLSGTLLDETGRQRSLQLHVATGQLIVTFEGATVSDAWLRRVLVAAANIFHADYAIAKQWVWVRASLAYHLTMLIQQAPVMEELDDGAILLYVDYPVARLHAYITAHITQAKQPWLQVMRWWLHDYDAATESMLPLLEHALQSDDWEVRFTALFVVARLQITKLAAYVRRLPIPDAATQELDRHDCELLQALRRVALALLKDDPVPPLPDGDLSNPQVMRVHIWRCAAGLPVAVHDWVFLLIHALTTPVPIIDHQPPHLPDGMMQRADGTYHLAGYSYVWIAPVSHWLGTKFDVSQSIRQVMLPCGFFIMRDVLRTDDDSVVWLTWDDAQAYQTWLSADAGVTLALPQPDEWEMAARSPDGRRFPWGNSMGSTQPSSWGLRDVVGVAPQWSADGHTLCGSDQLQPLAIRSTGTEAALRFVIRLDT
jgi:hypothetical protein